jgi:hypothetical protein
MIQPSAQTIIICPLVSLPWYDRFGVKAATGKPAPSRTDILGKKSAFTQIEASTVLNIKWLFAERNDQRYPAYPALLRSGTVLYLKPAEKNLQR